MLKRNDLCSCGSGKKYKKCCLEKDKKRAIMELKNKNLDDKKNYADRKYTDAIVKLIKSVDELVKNNEALQEAEKRCRESFYGDIEIDNPASDRFFNSFFSYDCFVDEENTPATLALKTMQFSDAERQVIMSCVYSHPSLFTITKMDGKEVILKDVFTEKEYYTLDYKLLSGFKEGEFLLGRPVKIDDIYVLTDLTIRIQEETKDMIYKGIMDAYEVNKESLANMEYFISINSLYFYKYMIQLLKISDYMENMEKEEKAEEEKKEDVKKEDAEKEKSIEIPKVEMNTNPHLISILKETVKDENVYSKIVELWEKIEGKLNVGGSHSGWAAGLEYYYRKSMGESVTQNEIAKNYGVSASTLAKRNKEIAAVCEE